MDGTLGREGSRGRQILKPLYAYAEAGKGSDYDVPTIPRVSDSFGNEVHPDPNDRESIFSLDEAPAQWLRSDDMLTAEVEVDPSFPENAYDVNSRVIGTGENRK